MIAFEKLYNDLLRYTEELETRIGELESENEALRLRVKRGFPNFDEPECLKRNEFITVEE